jgi:hypothetical protein
MNNMNIQISIAWIILWHNRNLTPKILSDQIWIAIYFGQALTYTYFNIFSFDFLYNFLKS